MLHYSDNPGSHERHLKRRLNNLLFEDNNLTEITLEMLIDSQEKDHTDLLAFHAEFRELFEQAQGLKPNVDSDVILKLKSRLDQNYEHASRIGDDQTATRNAIRQLLDVIMNAIRSGAQDPHAMQELAQETQAREAHFSLLESQLVADLLNPESPIQEDELVPTLLSATVEDLQLALQIFDSKQIAMIMLNGDKRLQQLKTQGHNTQQAHQSMEVITAYHNFLLEQDKEENA